MTDAKKAKNDEFYTQLSDIENELSHYRQYFRGKTVFCNCDDPEYSNFWKYFELNFEHFGLKRLIATHFDAEKPSYMLELVRDVDGDGHINGKDIIRTPLRQNGDFRSPECIELMRQADIVVTNPPFSLFREYVTQLMELEKKFVIIGNKNAVTYKEIFPLLKGGKLWVGYRSMNSDMWLYVPDSEPFEKVVNNRHAKHIMACWYTNLDITKRHEEMILYRTYRGHEDEYPTYDNYNAINVDKVCDIPLDYGGVMGVPITFLDKYNPEQFEIVWTTDRGGDGHLEDIKKPCQRYDAPVIDGHGLYKRIIIRNLHPDV